MVYYTEEELRCPKCKKIATKLVALVDNAKPFDNNIRYCHDCKKSILKKAKK